MTVKSLRYDFNNCILRGELGRREKLLKSGIDINHRDNLGQTTLWHCEDILTWLLENIEAWGYQWQDDKTATWTNFTYAEKREIFVNATKHLIKWMIDHGADKSIRDHSGKTAAESCSYPELKPLLV